LKARLGGKTRESYVNMHKTYSFSFNDGNNNAMMKTFLRGCPLWIGHPKLTTAAEAAQLQIATHERLCEFWL